MNDEGRHEGVRADDGLSPDEAFKILGNGTRFTILRTLWAADDGPLGFSELYRRTGVSDSGQFNYHLDKLVPHFVTLADDGYDLSTAGGYVVRSVVAGTATESPTLDPVDIDAACPACAGRVSVRYRDGFLFLTCADCDGFWRDADHPAGTLGTLSFPPAALRNRTPTEAMEAGAIFLVDRADTAMKGVCPTCAGRIETEMDLCTDHDNATTGCEACGNPFIGVFKLRCGTCKNQMRAPSFAIVHHHPTVEAMYGDAPGVTDDPWSWMWRGIAWPETVVSEDPPRFHTVVEHAGEDHVFEVDADGTVTQLD